MAKIGYDGEPPEFVSPRDILGKEARTLPDIWNVGSDRLNWYLAHEYILPHQHDAGIKLQRDNELAQIGGYQTCSENGGGTSGTIRLPDAKCDAIDRVNAAKQYVGPAAWRIIELVVFENISVGKAESRLRMATGNGALIVALDTLARHYGFA
jgi:hypothetical protein